MSLDCEKKLEYLERIHGENPTDLPRDSNQGFVLDFGLLDVVLHQEQQMFLSRYLTGRQSHEPHPFLLLKKHL